MRFISGLSFSAALVNLLIGTLFRTSSRLIFVYSEPTPLLRYDAVRHGISFKYRQRPFSLHYKQLVEGVQCIHRHLLQSVAEIELAYHDPFGIVLLSFESFYLPSF